MSKVLIVGASGQMGQSFQHLAKDHPNLSFSFASRKELDITNKTSISHMFDLVKPDFVINCAAYTAVDQAESEVALAEAINVNGPTNLAQTCKEYNNILIHFSTDYVYHNHLNRPLKEEDLLSPSSVYGKTKLQGEEAILNTHEKAIILRCSWIYGPFGHNFLQTMLRLMPVKEELNIVQDQIGTPGYSLDLARATLSMIQHPSLDHHFGIYNLSNSGVASWFDFAYAISKHGNFDLKIHAIPSRDYPTPAQRPHYSVMDTTKMKMNFEIELRSWQEALREAVTLCKI